MAEPFAAGAVHDTVIWLTLPSPTGASGVSGTPAGVKQAQVGTQEILIFGGLAAAGVTIAAVSGFGGGPLNQDLRGTATVNSTTANP